MGRDGDLVIKTLNTPGADIDLEDFGNYVGAVNFLSRNAGDTANATGQLTFYDDSHGFGVVQAAGGGINFKSSGPITLSTLTLGTPATLNIDAGNGDISLSTNGNIVIEGPGKLLAHNINLDLANTVTFSGGVSGTNYVPTQDNDLVVKATGNITINADVFTVMGGKVVGNNSEPAGPAGTPLISSNAIIDAGGTLKITTTGDFNVVGGGSQAGVDYNPITHVAAHADVGTGPGGVTFNSGTQNAEAQANAFITANTLDLTVGGNFFMTGGTVAQTGAATTATGSASAIIQAINGKQIKVAGEMILTGGTVLNAGKSKSNAFAELDPISTLNLEVDRNLVLVGGTGAGLVSASIVNSGEIKLDVGKSLTNPSDATFDVNGKTYDSGIILVGGSGSGRFDFNNNPLPDNAYPISWTIHNGGKFTIDTTAGAAAADAFIQSLAPRGVDPSLYGYLLFAIDRESTGKSKRSATDQGNLKTEVGSCN
jgi:hypothetical protein